MVGNEVHHRVLPLFTTEARMKARFYVGSDEMKSCILEWSGKEIEDLLEITLPTMNVFEVPPLRTLSPNI